MSDSVNDFLMGGGGKSAKFETKGDSVKGVILRSELRQQTDFTSKKPLFWDDGNPKMQVVVSLMTDEHEDDEDDGVRTLYVRGQMQKAVSDAVRKAGQRGIAEGGTLAVQFTGVGEKTGNLNPPKLYRAKYEPPTNVTPIPDDEEFEPF